MAKICAKALVHCLIAALFIALLGSAKAFPLCGIDSSKLESCRQAVTGDRPPSPDRKCCGVVRSANLPCLCGYKSALTEFGINPKNALALPKKCGLKTPPECQVN